MDKTPFPCDACGHCCRNVHRSDETNFLNRGDGICHFFDEDTHLCTIYESRPIVCRVEAYYDSFLSTHYTWDVFVKINTEICQKLKNYNTPQKLDQKTAVNKIE